jgi:hypothetical protein
MLLMVVHLQLATIHWTGRQQATPAASSQKTTSRQAMLLLNTAALRAEKYTFHRTPHTPLTHPSLRGGELRVN